LLQHGISSAPVYDAQKKTYVGMFDYSDLMTYVLLVLKKMEIPLEDQSMEMRDLIQKTSRSQNVPVKLASGKNTAFVSIVRMWCFCDPMSILNSLVRDLHFSLWLQISPGRTHFAQSWRRHALGR